MAMLINDNTHSVKVLNYYNRSTDGMQKSMMHLASGMKIGRSAEDPTNWAVSERMRDRIRALDQADRNIQNDTSLMKIAEASVSNTIDIINKLKERAVNAADDHNNEQDRAVIQNEAKVLLEQIDTNSFAASFNGKRLLDGSQADEGLNFHIGGEANFSVTLKLDNMSVESLGLDRLDLTTWEGAKEALGVRNADGTYSSYKTVTDPITGEETKVFGILDTALQKAIDQQTTIGAMEERLGYARENLIDANENMQAAESAITSADMAKEMTTYVKWNIISQAAQYMLAQQNQNAASILNLLAPVQ